MMAVDTQHMIDFIEMAIYFWSAPLQIIIAISLLWQQLGVATLAGIAFVVILIPTNGYIGKKVKDIGHTVMKLKDKRVKLMNEILNGIKVFKLYAWETSFRDQVFKIRQQEVDNLNKMAYLSGILNVIFDCTAFLVSRLGRLNQLNNLTIN